MAEADGEGNIDTFEREYKVMSLFIDNAKTYTQLSIGALYQYLACKFVEEKARVARSHRIRWGWIVSHPWPVYGLMLVTFYGGAISFTVGAILRLPHS